MKAQLLSLFLLAAPLLMNVLTSESASANMEKPRSAESSDSRSCGAREQDRRKSGQSAKPAGEPAKPKASSRPKAPAGRDYWFM